VRATLAAGRDISPHQVLLKDGFSLHPA